MQNKHKSGGHVLDDILKTLQYRKAHVEAASSVPCKQNPQVDMIQKGIVMNAW